eukprot:gene17380-21953_t
MRSTGGHLRTDNSFVQHFNPAVRAARFYPQYPVSRLLMNLSDTDLPLRPIAPAPFTLQSPPQLLVPYVGHVVWTWARRVAEEGLLHVVHLPVALQDVTWRWYLIVLLQTAAWALSWLYEANVGALIFVTLLVFAALVGLPLGLLLRDVYAARRRRRQVNRHIFSTMDADGSGLIDGVEFIRYFFHLGNEAKALIHLETKDRQRRRQERVKEKKERARLRELN